MATKDRIAHLKQELEEAKEQKKVSITEKDQIKTGKGINSNMLGGVN